MGDCADGVVESEETATLDKEGDLVVDLAVQRTVERLFECESADESGNCSLWRIVERSCSRKAVQEGSAYEDRGNAENLYTSCVSHSQMQSDIETNTMRDGTDDGNL